MRHPWLPSAAVLATVSCFAGCSAILGDFNTGPASDAGGPDGAPQDSPSIVDSPAIDSPAIDSPMSVDSGPGDTGSEDAPTSEDAPATGGDAGMDATATDAGEDASVTDSGEDTGPADAGEDTAVDPCVTPPTSVVYVNAATGSDTNTGGSPNCPFQTITAALAASAGPSYINAKISVAAGTYAAGETFPLVVNHGRSLIGAGAGTTTIQGSSAAYNTSNTKSFLDPGTGYVPTYITILAGDPPSAPGLVPILISGFSVLPAASVSAPTTGYLGLVCIQGNGPNEPATLPLPQANLVVQETTFGPNFDVGLTTGSQPVQETACNLRVTTSTFTGNNVGITTGRCGTANPAGSWASGQIGDGVDGDQNLFSANGIDLYGNGCGSAQSINMNSFESGYRGVVLNSNPNQYFEILENSFLGGSTSFPMGIGVQTSGAAQINKLNGNSFTGIAESAAADSSAGGVGTTGYAVMVAQVLQAHSNFIYGNDNGLELIAVPASTFDFSADGVTTNANQIYCNSKPQGLSTVGYDVILDYTSSNPANLAGNYFDRAPPSIGTSLTASANGTDVVVSASGDVATLTGAMKIGTVVCPGNRVE